MKELEILYGGKIKAIRGLEHQSEDVYIDIEKTYKNTTMNSTIHIYHEQDCCESVSLEEWHGNIENGETLLKISKREEAGESDWGTSTWSFIVIETNVGVLTLRWYGESNGYYSESVDFEVNIPDGIYEDDYCNVAYFDGIAFDILQKKIYNGLLYLKGKYKEKWLDTESVGYIVSNGSISAHGYDFRDALSDFQYKLSKRDLSEYNNLTLDSELTYNEAISMYRSVTGACSFGTNEFLERKKLDKNKTYTIREIIKLTNGEFGNRDLVNFLNKFRY